MIARELIARAEEYLLVLSVDGENLVVQDYSAEQNPPGELIAQLRSHKSELLGWLRWEAEATRLIEVVYRRLAPHWVPGCPSDDEGYLAHERTIDAAFAAHGRSALVDALLDFEAYARSYFEEHRRLKT